MQEFMGIVQRVYAGPLVWGLRDCCTCPGDVWLALGRPDPVAEIRGRYASEAGALALMEAMGGWQDGVAGVAHRAGLRPGQGAPGEIGLARVPVLDGTGYALALSIGRGMWAIKTGDGYRTVRRVVQAWAS